MAVAIPFFCAAGRKVREEHMDISFSAIAACWASAALCIVLPIALLVIVRVKTHRGLLAALTGALCFTVSALVLEQLLHSIVFSSFPTLIQSPGLYTAYACLAAGVFEETARYLGLSLLCRRDASLVTGFAYGTGHGGIEAILLAGTASLSNAIVLSAARGGSLEAMFGSDIAATVSAQLASGVSAGALLLPGLERVAAITLHLALSILVDGRDRAPAQGLFGTFHLPACRSQCGRGPVSVRHLQHFAGRGVDICLCACHFAVRVVFV